MQETTRLYYQKMLKDGFEYAGKIPDASIVIKTFDEVSAICGTPDNFLFLDIQITDNLITDIKYQCISDPITNVAVEILCALMKGKTLQEALLLRADAFLHYLGCEDETLRELAVAFLAPVHKRIRQYH
jgi:NifU-like protein involved in Fe-S cluster formation